MYPHKHAHAGHETHIPGVTEDPILRPLGAVLVIFGLLWALFIPMALRAGTMDLPHGALGMIVGGLILAAIGKRERQI